MEVDYAKIGNKVYGLKLIEAENVDINEELKEFYKDRQDRLAKEFGEVITADANQQWNTQINHLQKFSGRGEFKIGREMHGKPVMVWNNRLFVCRFIVYAPNEVVTCKYYLRSYNHDIARVCFPTDNENDTVLLTIKPIFHLPMVLCFDKKTDKMFTPFLNTIHTMNGHNICTGNYKASDFWKLNHAALTKEMNRVNTFSPASTQVRFGNYSTTLRDMVNRHTITDVVRRESVEWRT